MNRIVLAVMVFLLGSLGVRGKNVDEEELQLALAKANNLFGWKMYQELKNTQENLIFSPLSLSSPMMLLWSASRGRTKEEISEALDLPQQYDDTVLHDGFLNLQKGLQHKGRDMTLTIAEGLITNQQLRPEFENFYKDYDLVMVTELDTPQDFVDALNTINEFVAKKTHNKIMKILDSLSNRTTMVLVDALYFKGKWRSPFDPEQTDTALFRTSTGTTIPTQMMYHRSFFPYVHETDYQALKLDYQGGMSMVVLLPRNVDGIQQLEESLPNFDWDDLDNKLESGSTMVKVTFPKFLIESNFQLVDALQELGISALFGEDADLSKMFGDSRTYVSEVVQKTFIKFCEQGTEAAAATAVVWEFESNDEYDPKFNADHPFIFLLRHDKSKTNVLIGRVVEPKEDRSIYTYSTKKKKQTGNGKQDWKPIEYVLLKPVRLKHTSNVNKDLKPIEAQRSTTNEDHEVHIINICNGKSTINGVCNISTQIKHFY